MARKQLFVKAKTTELKILKIMHKVQVNSNEISDGHYKIYSKKC